MSEHVHNQDVPRGVLFAAAALIVFSIGVAALSSQHTREVAAEGGAPVINAAQVRFEDRKDGAIAMLDAATGRELSVVPPNSNGFIRGVLRGMMRSRKLESLGRDATFRLARHQDGRLSIEDQQTHRSIDLGAFGPTNLAAFETLFAAAGPQASR
jgi:putative photosynthetic complex assembly protein